MLTRIRNANMVKLNQVKVIRTSLTFNIVQILEKEGFIESFEGFGEVYLTDKGFLHKYILVNLKYRGVKQKPCFTYIKRISRPGSRVYVSSKRIDKVLGGIGVAICNNF